MQQPVEDRGGDDGVSEHAAPLADRAIAGDQHAAALVAARHQLEEQMRRIGLERQVAELIHDQQLGLGEMPQALLDPALGLGLGELRHQARGGDKEHRVAGQDRLAAERYRQVCLADAGRAQQQHRLAVGDKAPGGEFADLLLVERGLGGEVEAVEIADEREAR